VDSYPDKKLWQTHGADALTYVRFLRMCLLCCLVTTTISCSILLPLNLSGTDDHTPLSRPVLLCPPLSLLLHVHARAC
jgi:hypothetical protein